MLLPSKLSSSMANAIGQIPEIHRYRHCRGKFMYIMRRKIADGKVFISSQFG
jgi:hypothetical protein